MSFLPTHPPPARLRSQGAIRVSGVDARTFLQGQLSADIAALTAQRGLLACCNSVQGRVQAVMWLIERRDGIALILAASMVEMITARLRKYVLRSKVVIEPAPERLSIAIVASSALPSGVALSEPGASQELEGTTYVRLPGHDSIVVLTEQPVADAERSDEVNWQLENIRAGLPQVYPATHEAFVAQMLNLDLLGGISFQKGCYTGQEIIARTHYRGAIKRRMLRFAATCPPPEPGTRVLAGEQHAGDVVDSASSGDGCELLTVVSLTQANDGLRLAAAENAALEKLGLPYQIGG